MVKVVATMELAFFIGESEDELLGIRVPRSVHGKGSDLDHGDSPASLQLFLLFSLQPSRGGWAQKRQVPVPHEARERQKAASTRSGTSVTVGHRLLLAEVCIDSFASILWPMVGCSPAMQGKFGG